MGEGNHSNTTPTGPGPKRKIVLMAAGTAVAVVAAAVLIQFLRAPAGISAENPRGQSREQQGRASLDARQNDRPLARVGDRLITYDEVAEECVARFGNDVLEKLINRTIIQVACEERGVTVTADEVQREIVDIARKFNLTVEQWFQMLQAERNLTPEQYQWDIIWPMLALKKLAGEKVVVTEEDMRQGFIRDYGVRMPVMQDYDRTFGNNYGVGTIPVVYLINEKGEFIRYSSFNYQVTPNQIREAALSWLE
jgi:foldase protein PrsA